MFKHAVVCGFYGELMRERERERERELLGVCLCATHGMDMVLLFAVKLCMEFVSAKVSYSNSYQIAA